MRTRVARTLGSGLILGGASSLFVAFCVLTGGSLAWGTWRFALPMASGAWFITGGAAGLWAGARLRRRALAPSSQPRQLDSRTDAPVA